MKTKFYSVNNTTRKEYLIMKVTLKSDRELIQKDNNAHKKLIDAGFLPQGYDFKKGQICVFKRENEHMRNQKTEVYYFDSWLDAVKELINQ